MKKYSLLFLLLVFRLLVCAQSFQVSSTFDSTQSYPHLNIERSMVYAPAESWMYSHHPYLACFKGRYIAIWSNGMKDEDDPGQRVAIASSLDLKTWTTVKSLAEPSMGADSVRHILTAAGFYEYEGRLTAYFGSYSRNRTDTRLYAMTSGDGIHWSEPVDQQLPVIPNHAPCRIDNGRLIICGNFSFPYSENLDGSGPWKMSGFYPQEMGHVSDNPWSFWKISKGMELPAHLCEGSFYQTDDHVLHMLLRSAGVTWDGYLWLTESRDYGSSWSRPVKTSFPDNDHKFHFDRLKDGRFYYVGCPVSFPRERRSPLVLSLSDDGKVFSSHFIIADSPYQRRSEGRYKAGQYGYPSTFEHDGFLYIIVSRQKEGIEVLRVNLAECSRTQ